MSEDGRRLPIGYYLLNFETVLREVRARYGDLLHEEELRRLEAFLALPLAARRLYVRMLSRKGPWFREDDLHYPEIGAPGELLETLAAAGFCERRAPARELVALLLKAERVAWLARFTLPAPKGATVEDLGRLLLAGAEPAALEEDLQAALRPAKPLQGELWSLVSFLFFGNGEQDLSSFLLADLGLVHYETYALDPAHRLFESRRDLDFLLSLRHLREAFGLAAATDDPVRMAALTEEILAMEPHPGVRQQRRYHRLLNELGRAWERRKAFGPARECYRRSRLPPARERLTRICEGVAEACGMAIQMAEMPLDASEERFARVFLERHRRRDPAAQRWIQEHPPAEAVPDLHLVLPRQASVELAALEAARGLGWEGRFSENQLWNALFGLVFWDVLFAPVPGAFQHRFQSAPMDIGHPDFFAQRREAFEERLAELQDPSALRRHVLEMAKRKRGIANAFVSWRHLDQGLLEAATARLPPAVLASVLRTLAQSPRAFSSGFPDLFLFRPGGSEWTLWEVKGPGDSLRPEQERWLRRFQQLGCKVGVAWVKWESG